MRKLVCIVVLLISFMNLNQAKAQLRIAPQIGLNRFTLAPSVLGITDNFYRSGLRLGAILDVPLVEGKNFYLRPGLIYSSKGDLFLVGTTDIQTIINFVEVPVMFNFTFPVGKKGFKLFANVGPYVGFALGGKIKSENGDEQDLSFGSSNEDNYKSLDFGLNTAFGMEYKSFTFDLQASYGFVDLNPSDNFEELSQGN